MRSVRRRAAEPTLNWRSAGPDRHYRVAVRNEDTGERQIVYEGFRQDCRLPADLRLTADQLTFWVGSRAEQDVAGPFLRCQDYVAIPRLGDELDVDAADRLRVTESPGASAYRLRVRDWENKVTLVDMVGTAPSFLLPIGRLADRTSHWTIQPRVRGRWGRARWREVTSDMITAGAFRSARLIELKEPVRPRLEAIAGEVAPGRDEALPEAESNLVSLALALPVSAFPMLAPDPSAASVVAAQWLDGRGGGAMEHVSHSLAEAGLSGSFFLDLAAGHALDIGAMRALADQLLSDGHCLGLLIGETRWDAFETGPAVEPADRVKRQLDQLRDLADVGASPPVMLAAETGGDQWLAAARDAGVAGVVAPRRSLLGCARWMRWRTAPFSAVDGLVVFPTAMMLSTPAHPRDQVVRHPINNRDALAVGSAETVLGALAALDDAPRLLITEIDPVSMLVRRRIRSQSGADIWNSTLRQALPGWWKAGWKRAGSGFDQAEGINEIQSELLAGLLTGLKATGLPWATPRTMFEAARVRGWLAPSPAFEPLVEQRRGPRRMKDAASRRYDAAFRLALQASRS